MESDFKDEITRRDGIVGLTKLGVSIKPKNQKNRMKPAEPCPKFQFGFDVVWFRFLFLTNQKFRFWFPVCMHRTGRNQAK